MELLGPDGKEMTGQSQATISKPSEPNTSLNARRMPTRQEKFNMIYMMVTLMTSEERRMLKKSLRPLIRQLDIKYPNGMSEGDMKNDIEKAVDAVLPDGENSQTEVTEVGTEPSVPVQQESNDGGPEAAPLHEGDAQ